MDESLYGVERIKEKLASGPADVSELGDKIVRSAQAFVAGHPQSDDICVICVQRDPQDDGDSTMDFQLRR